MKRESGGVPPDGFEEMGEIFTVIATTPQFPNKTYIDNHKILNHEK